MLPYLRITEVISYTMMIIVKYTILHEYNKDCEGDGVQEQPCSLALWHFVACAQHMMRTYIKPVLGKAEVQPLS